MKNNKLIVLVIVTAVAVFLSTYPMNYYISRPGGAYELSPLVEVDGGDIDDEGTLSLMTVSMLNATPVLYLLAQFQDGYKILKPEEVRSPHESDEEYQVRQLKLMSDSQVNALQVAFEKAEMPYEVKNNGVFVMNVLEGGAAHEVLAPGDQVLSMDGNGFETQEEFVDYIASKAEGEKVDLMFERDGRKITETIALAPLPTEPERIGLGITFVENKEIKTTPEVEIDSENIGGPSAGLMFTLEILNQLLEEDITKGYDIAGTGTMASSGEVGRIGGIDQKVIAADNEDIDIFFAPDDETEGTSESNYDVAKKTAEKIGTDMQIVPVQTVDDAIGYLKDLQPK